MQEANEIAARLRAGGQRGVRYPSRSGARKGTSPSPRSLEVLEYLQRFFAENDQLPPIARIAAEFGWGSAQSAHEHMHKLARWGYIEPNAVGKWRFVRDRG
jgi:SOS-response transcriptional repressor LexA